MEPPLEALGLRADETVFIDDLRPNIDAARRLGMHVIHFDSYALRCATTAGGSARLVWTLTARHRRAVILSTCVGNRTPTGLLRASKHSFVHCIRSRNGLVP